MSHELPDGYVKDVVGYCDPLSARPGDAISFKVSSHTPGPAQFELVRLISGDDRPHGTGLIEAAVDGGIPSEVGLDHQPLVQGSYATIDDMPALTEAKISVWFYPTLPSESWRTLMNCAGTVISTSAEGVRVTHAGEALTVAMPMSANRWYRLTLAIADAVELSVLRRGGGVAEADTSAGGQMASVGGLSGGTWVLAATERGQDHFNGRLEAPAVASAGATVAAWDFADGIGTQGINDTGPNARHGVLHQNPTRGVCGLHWDGTVQSYHVDASHYGAIHFHEDDITDARWQETLSLTVPADWSSGQYALKVTQGESQDYIPFFVRPPAGTTGSALAYLVPTASYLAYANQRIGITDGPLGSAQLFDANMAYLKAHEEVGYSMYEHHRDGSGVHFSSRLRPVLNMKPLTATWAFNADTHITAWLDAIDQPFDVLTDEDLHLEGAAALAGYRCVITGSHPEYYSTAMRDGLKAWLGEGNRLMYMGGNGFYWRVAFQPDNPAVMEVRRAEDGTRAWMAEPGAYYHQFGGEYGGMWRRLGYPPNELVGIGFAAQGFDGGTYYRVQPGAIDPRVAFMMEGVDELAGGDTWGAFGNQGGGAAGEEIDRHDVALGSPEHAVIVATSEEHKRGMLRVKEEFHMMDFPRQDDPHVRADMVFFEVPGGGAVFSTGSISYAGSLAHNDYENEIARLTGNVVRRFLDPERFEMPPARSSS